MGIASRKLSKSFKAFFDSEKSSGILLITCTVVSIVIANSIIGPSYLGLWQMNVGGLRVEEWVNDALMAVFFLLIGLELERELYNGELSNIKNGLLPIFAAAGGVAFPALIHYSLNAGTPTQSGIGIPMATDIAFSLGVLSLLGNRVPASLKVFLTALAVSDDLAAIIVIAVFYTTKFSILYLAGALVIFGLLILLKRLQVMSLVPYLLGGVLMWGLMLKSGVHATLAGVLLAFTIPFSARQDDEKSPSHKLEHTLNWPVAFIILPIFALANTGVVITSAWAENLMSPNSLGIIFGLVLGKPLGIASLTFVAVALGICKLSTDLNWRHIIGAGLLGGIGFTVSIFITNLAFVGDVSVINGSKIAILVASMVAGIFGFLWLRVLTKPEHSRQQPPG